MSKSTNITMGITEGIEFEVENIPVGGTPPSVLRDFNLTHDASCESDSYKHYSGFSVERNSPLGNLISPTLKKIVLGGEYVSNILDTSKDEHRQAVERLITFIRGSGESAESYRAGIHVHVSFGSPSLSMLKHLVKLWLSLEDVIYYLGGMGYEHRGMRNDFTYCRPISKYGIVIPYNGNRVKLIDINDLLGSSGLDEFWTRFGDTSNVGRNRYFPVRYHGLNLSPVLTKGTVEFRVFNKSLNPDLIVAIMNFCSAFVNISIGASVSPTLRSSSLFNTNNSLFNRRSKTDIVSGLENFGAVCISRELLTAKDLEILVSSIKRVPEIHPENIYIITHLRSFPNHWQSSSYSPVVVKNSECINPNFVDIHVLRGER